MTDEHDLDDKIKHLGESYKVDIAKLQAKAKDLQHELDEANFQISQLEESLESQPNIEFSWLKDLLFEADGRVMDGRDERSWLLKMLRREANRFSWGT